MAGPGEVIVNVTCGSRQLETVVVANTTPFRKFKHLIEDVSGRKNVRMLYVDDEGDHVCLDNSDEFLEALRVAHSSGLLQLIVVEGSEPKVCHRRKGGTSTYTQLAQDMGERQRAAKEAAHALLAKLPCEPRKDEGREKKENADAEPEWFESAMKKHTETVVANILKELNGAVIASICEPAAAPAPNVLASLTADVTGAAVVHQGIVCDGCERAIVGIRYKCGNCLDYDLCDACEKVSDILHPGTHVFVKMKRPVVSAGYTRKGKLKPLLRTNLYGDSHVFSLSREARNPLRTVEAEKTHPQSQATQKVAAPSVAEAKQEPNPEAEAPCQSDSGHEEGEEPTAHFVRRSKKQLRKDLKKDIETVSEGFLASGVSRPRDQLREEVKRKKKQRKEHTLTSPTAVMKGHGKCLDATFVADTTCPDRQVVTYGKPFTKGWIIENSGTKKWKRVKLVHQEGFRPLQAELNIPEVAPGEQVELSVEYPAISPSDGVEIKSSWKLIHNEKTPFGCVLWLSIVAQYESLGELAATFEDISYPSLPPSLTAQPLAPFGFASSAPSSDVPPAAPAAKEEVDIDRLMEEFSVVEAPTPVLSLSSNDSFHQAPPLSNAEDNDDAASVSGSSESDFVVVVPDCFNLDVPLAGFKPPVQEPPTPSSESGDSQLINMTVSDFEPQPNAVHRPEPNEQLHSPAEEDESSDQPSHAALGESHSPVLNPKAKATEFSPQPMTLKRVWNSGSRNPISFAAGLVNTATNLLDAHVHFIPLDRDRAWSDPVNGNEDGEEDQVQSCEGSANEVAMPSSAPSAPPVPGSDESTPNRSPTLSNHRPDVSHFLNRRWSGPDPPATPMEKLISMGFANRSLNDRLLKKHKNHLPAILNELLDTDGDGYLEIV